MIDSTSDDLFGALDELFTRLISISDTESIDALVELDLSFSQVRVLFALTQRDSPIPINEVADELRLSVAATGRNIDQLVNMGLIDRREDERDRRVKRVSLSEAGRKVTSNHIECKRGQLREFASRVPTPDALRLVEALEPILAGEYLRAFTQETSR
ncbi:MarR family transcriptional regulator [Rhodococcus sp. SRB_17]|uniref:MarR family winged helix-turn-helix transcriptional regulator n=1 Tax=Rhodococcus sp. OK302 TaxID=1882769 RepID=UPI000B93C5F3|nr:MarR family winged helix-turn-helix transcriptional regulator [Rhodococcus sp. OK302]NMM84042.1 MarR family transcriptional regulator [Rhodococcus sp. SRB_17]OYD68860.1 DNA-binding MarR family transcriptional regulator [Rhodococcus sp. OK302]